MCLDVPARFIRSTSSASEGEGRHNSKEQLRRIPKEFRNEAQGCDPALSEQWYQYDGGAL